MLIQASITAGVRPTTMILGEDNRKAWSRLDVLIMQAWQIVQAEQCPDCGNPVWLCRNTDPLLNVKIEKQEDCYAMSEVKQYNEDHKDTESRGRAVFYSRDGRPLHEYRALYYQQRAAEAQD